MKKILFISLLLVCAVLGSAYGQSDKLIFSNPVSNGTSFLKNETLIVSVNVTFISAEGNANAGYPIHTLACNYRVNGLPGSTLSIQSPVLVLLHQKTVTLQIHIPINNLFQEGGGHVIIIWPITTVPADVVPGSFQLPEIIYVQIPPSFVETKPDINPYPNPTTGTVVVEVPDGGAEVYLYNLSGHCVVKNPPGYGKRRSVDMGSLPSGTYVLVVRTGGKYIRKQIVKL